MMNARRIYPLDGTGLTPEQMAVVFAMTSRSPDSFDEIAARVSEESAADFHEKWVLDYGHASVAEHAVSHLAIENISRVAADQLENNRLASYTEKSSRYQVIERGSYYTPHELGCPRSLLRKTYQEAMDYLFGTYHSLLAACQARLRELDPHIADVERESAYRLRLRRVATDACRGVLSAATLTNVGMTANARILEHAISKLISSALRETQDLGEELRTQGRSVTPTLVKYADYSEYLASPPQTSDVCLDESRFEEDVPAAALVGFNPQAVEDLATALLYRSGDDDYIHAWAKVREMGSRKAGWIVRDALERLGPHDAPPREFETVNLMFELQMDYGALREFRRHRMMTPLFQPLTTKHGVNIPSTIRKTDLQKMFVDAAEAAEGLYAMLAQEAGSVVAQYAVTHAHLQQVLVSLNLRECYHLFQLRTSERAHESIRLPMTQALQEAARYYPVLFAPLLLPQLPLRSGSDNI